ncbi:MAG: hypothetical protein ABW215_18740 [Kibdelosporangium sp.]
MTSTATIRHSGVNRSLWAAGWRRLAFTYAGPGKRRQWTGLLTKAGPPTSHFLSAIAGFISVVLSLFVFYLVARIATYGIFWTGEGTAGSWGGPTLAGAWLVHALIAAPMVAAAMWLLVPVTNLLIRGLR